MGDSIRLSPGQAFKLQPDGKWEASDLPTSVIESARFSGYLTIQGRRCVVFETPDLDQWAQKINGTSELAFIAIALSNSSVRRKSAY
jgi:hypothetical protein